MTQTYSEGHILQSVVYDLRPQGQPHNGTSFSMCGYGGQRGLPRKKTGARLRRTWLFPWQSHTGPYFSIA